MKNEASVTQIDGLLGTCGSLKVFLGFAPARLLHAVSFADTLNEDTGEGYQRPPNRGHSRDFKRYITQPGATTIPLTFNLRSEHEHAWQIRREEGNRAILLLHSDKQCMAQVDCQHRLSELQDLTISLAFMTFIGLDLRSEMAVFFIINSKAKGLSSSLTDYHRSKLLDDLAEEAPHLYIAKKLNEDPRSPWFRLIRYGGETTSGLKRRTSLRMMQKTLARLLKTVEGLPLGTVEDKCDLVISFWRAVRAVFGNPWRDHRHHLITKGVGLYSLTLLLADVIKNADGKVVFAEDYFIRILLPLRSKIDWSSDGMFANAGGQKGAMEVHGVLKGAMGI